MPKGIYKRTEKTKQKLREVAFERLKNNPKFKRFEKGNKYRFPKGFIPWHKGTKGLIKPNSGNFQKGSGGFGGKHTDEAKKKMSEAKKGKRGHLQAEETKRKIREWHINHPNRKFKDTNIELRIEEELKRRGIYYQKQVPLCKVAIVDFYLPECRVVIQCDGDYWHNLSSHKERDEKQDKVLTFNGFNVYRFWEHEINQSVEKCIDKIL